MPESGSERFPADLPAWEALTSHHLNVGATLSTRELFAAEPGRFEKFSLGAGDLFLDYSRNLVAAETRALLLDLAEEAGVPGAIDAMFRGADINVTERRPALHVALRAEAADEVALNVPGIAEIGPTLDSIERFVTGVHAGDVRGHTGKRLTDIVNIGIGGSDLGLVMAARALHHHRLPGMTFHAASNVDGTRMADLATSLDPERTLFVVCSKTFTTRETLANAERARRFVAERLGEAAVGAHFAAASTNHAAMDNFGLAEDRRFGFWDWVGGRYSLWSAVGLSLALTIGMDNFRELLAGARSMDRHFRSAPLAANMPVILALIDVWNRNFLRASSHAILPYDDRLDRLPAYLQQLCMESNGKLVRTDGDAVQAATGAVIWGEPGSNAQHSFYQLLHQGSDVIPVDFILPVRSSGAGQADQDLAIADCLAQGEAMMDGFSEPAARAALAADGATGEEASRLAPHKVHPGDRPSNTILMPELSPSTLGQLLALYEHRVYVQGVIWGINSFDQYGVELGKRLAGPLDEAVRGERDYAGHNGSTAGLLDRVQRLRR